MIVGVALAARPPMMIVAALSAVSALLVGAESASGEFGVATGSAAPAARSCPYGTNSGPQYVRCPFTLYRITINASAENSSVGWSGAAKFTIAFEMAARYQRIPQKGYYPPSINMASGPPKKLSFNGSGRSSSGDCSPSGPLKDGSLLAALGGGAGEWNRSRKPTRTYYHLKLSFQLTQRGTPKVCSIASIADHIGRRPWGDYFLNVTGTETQEAFALELDFYRPQKAGKMEFPLNRLTEGKGFEISVGGLTKGQDGAGTWMKANAVVRFTPIRSG